MTDESVPKGLRFSQLYLPKTEPMPDSARMRRRIGSIIGETNVAGFGDAVRGALGVKLKRDPSYGFNWPEIIEEMELRDVLDTITVRYQTLISRNTYGSIENDKTAAWRKMFVYQVRKVFTEEHVHYILDDLGGVHFAVDAEFARTNLSTIGALQIGRYNNVRTQFDGALAALDNVPPDGKAGIRLCFTAAEGLYCLMFPRRNQLKSQMLSEDLKPLLEAFYTDQRARLVAQKQLSGFREWIDAAHFYRHEPGTEEPAQPPLEIAVELISVGAAMIRWLARIDASKTA
jgi:hypothetical protein